MTGNVDQLLHLEWLRLYLSGKSYREIANQFSTSHTRVRKHVTRLLSTDLETLCPPVVETPPTRGKAAFVHPLLSQGCLIPYVESGHWKPPTPPAPDDMLAPDSHWGCWFWLLGRHRATGSLAQFKKRAANTTTLLKCPECNPPRRVRQLERVEQNTSSNVVRYVFEEQGHYQSAAKNAKRNSVPIVLRSTETPKGLLRFVIAADTITSKRMARRGNERKASRQYTLSRLDNGMCHVDDLARFGTTREFRLTEEDDLEPRTVRANYESPYEWIRCGGSRPPLEIAAETVGRDVGRFDSLTDDEWVRVRLRVAA